MKEDTALSAAIGQIVRATAGRDKDGYFVVVGSLNGRLLVSNGRERPLERPKQKNPRHLTPTVGALNEQQMLTNRSVQRGLKTFIRSLEGDE